jgi:hypothetical protein
MRHTICPRRFYVNRDARVGETFGVFADFQEALVTLRFCKRDEKTHTIKRTSIGFVVTCKGYQS